MSDKVKVHKITVLVCDLNRIGIRAWQNAIESIDECSSEVMSVETVDVDWHDAHPLNYKATTRAEFDRLFGDKK